ncbi:MAG: response regulator [Planctomycetaceae bacterium]
MRQRRILVVDDEKNIRLMLSHVLAADDTVVETAVNGEEALDKINETTYDLVLLDLRMPGMDGLNVLREIKTHAAKLPVIVLTAHGTVESAVDAMQIGAANFLQKPFAPRELREAVEHALKSSAEFH